MNAYGAPLCPGAADWWMRLSTALTTSTAASTPRADLPRTCPQIFRPQYFDKNSCDIGKSQSKRTASKMETPSAQPLVAGVPLQLHVRGARARDGLEHRLPFAAQRPHCRRLVRDRKLPLLLEQKARSGRCVFVS
jgi:hypothetical protein